MNPVLLLGLLVAVVGAMPTRADAAPRADLVVLWAPGRDPTAVAAACRVAGAALLDRTPATPPSADAAQALGRGIDAYEALRLDEAWAALTEARTSADQRGGADLTTGALSDLFLYRGLVQIQREQPAAAWEELVTALAVAPTRVFDPARFGPRVLDELERARRAALARPRVTLALVAPPGCAVAVDGVAAGATATVIAGAHWIHARCAADVRWGARIDAVEPTGRVAIEPRAPAAPTDEEVLIQLRASGAGAAVIIVARGELASLRLLTVDGRERDRRTVALRAGDQAVAAALTTLLRPTAPARWHQSRWVWAAGAAAVAAAVLIPVTAALAGGGAAAAVTIRGPGSLP